MPKKSSRTSRTFHRNLLEEAEAAETAAKSDAEDSEPHDLEDKEEEPESNDDQDLQNEVIPVPVSESKASSPKRTKKIAVGSQKKFRDFLEEISGVNDAGDVHAACVLMMAVLQEGVVASTDAAASASTRSAALATYTSHRLKLASTIADLHKDTASLFLNSLYGCFNWTESVPDVTQAVNKDLADTIRVISTLKDSGYTMKAVKKLKERCDRIRKNRIAFFPAKLERSDQLAPFLAALKLACGYTPFWDDVLKFHHSDSLKTKHDYSIYDYLHFHNAKTVVKTMFAYDFHRASLEEGQLSLFLSVKGSLSKEVSDRLDLYKDVYKTNGAALLVCMIKLLSPETNKIRTETAEYLDKLQSTLVAAKWDIISIAPKIREVIMRRKHAGGDMSGVHTKVINSFANSGEGSYQTKHQAWVSNHKDSGDGTSALKYLYKSVEWVKDLSETDQWKGKQIPDILQSDSKKRKGADDADLAGFTAEAKALVKKLKTENSQLKNHSNQLKANAADHTSKPAGNHTRNGGSGRGNNSGRGSGGSQKPKAPASHSRAPPGANAAAYSKGDNTYARYNEKQWSGSNATFKDKATFDRFVKGEDVGSTEEAEKGYTIVSEYGTNSWFWCGHCNRMGSHPTKKHKSPGGGNSRPAPPSVAAHVAAHHQTVAADDDDDGSISLAPSSDYEDGNE